jgi:hypothetical protein
MICSCCGFDREKGVITGENNGAGFHQEFICDSCTSFEGLSFPFSRLDKWKKQYDSEPHWFNSTLFPVSPEPDYSAGRRWRFNRHKKAVSFQMELFPNDYVQVVRGVPKEAVQ